MLDRNTRVKVWFWLRLNSIWVKNKLPRVCGAAAYPVRVAAYMRTVRIKLTQSSWAEAGTELGNIENTLDIEINDLKEETSSMAEKGNNVIDSKVSNKEAENAETTVTTTIRDETEERDMKERKVKEANKLMLSLPS